MNTIVPRLIAVHQDNSLIFLTLSLMSISNNPIGFFLRRFEEFTAPSPARHCEPPWWRGNPEA